MPSQLLTLRQLQIELQRVANSYTLANHEIGINVCNADYTRSEPPDINKQILGSDKLRGGGQARSPQPSAESQALLRCGAGGFQPAAVQSPVVGDPVIDMATDVVGVVPTIRNQIVLR